jgi:tetratricopeptide (TPR) repeat protein
MTTHWRIATGSGLVVLSLLFGAQGLARAAGNGGSDGPRRSEDRELAAAVHAIDSGNFAAAIPLLEAVVARDGKNADAYNYLGYAVRRNGDPARSIGIYEKALALDPRHRGAHEYIGEAYLALDDLPKAKMHLAALDKLCFLPCGPYRDLKKAIEAYERSGGQTKPQATR